MIQLLRCEARQIKAGTVRPAIFVFYAQYYLKCILKEAKAPEMMLNFRTLYLKKGQMWMTRQFNRQQSLVHT